ncbi:hypothetical protein FQZ97_1023430 [compost metagenome]
MNKRAFVGDAFALLESLCSEGHGLDVGAAQHLFDRATQDGIFVQAVLVCIVAVGVLAAQRIAVVRHHDGYRVAEVPEKRAPGAGF